MRSTAATIFGLTAVSSALAQQNMTAPPMGNMTAPMGMISPESIAQGFLQFLTPNCQSAILNLTSPSSPVFQCLQVESLLPALTTNGSIIPPVDEYLADVCAADPCSNAVLNSTAQTVIQSCSSSLEIFGIGNDTIYEVFGLYPLAREVACLKTVEPESFNNASIPINSTAYNSTNGTFCVTDVLTDLSGYLGANLTNNYIDTLALGQNATGLQILESIPQTALCQDCIYAALDLIYTEYPQLGNVTINQNVTLNGYLNSTCAAVGGFNVTSNGTLPDSINVAAENSTFPETIIGANFTYTPGPSATAAPSLNATVASVIETAVASASGGMAGRGYMAEKRRWIGRN